MIRSDCSKSTFLPALFLSKLNSLFRRNVRATPFAVLTIVAATAMPSFTLQAQQTPANVLPFKQFNSRHYRVFSTVNMPETQYYARHMDIVFEEYKRRFDSINPDSVIDGEKLPLYLMRTHKEYNRFLQRLRPGAPEQTGGMFFKTRAGQGLATFTHHRKLSITRTITVLQHEGFHQFAQAYFAQRLPIWVNEGLAQYFEDGFIVGDRMHLQVCNGQRLRLIKQALKSGQAIPFKRLLSMDKKTWWEQILGSKKRGPVAYAQTWSMVYFLVHGRGGGMREAFNAYLRKLNQGMSSRKAFQAAFQTNNVKAFQRSWAKFIRRQQPGALSRAEERLIFLAHGLKATYEHKRLPEPDSMEELESTLRRADYKAVRRPRGPVSPSVQYRASDDAMFRYTTERGKKETFVFLPPAAEAMRPRIRAAHLKPQPTLTWYYNADGELGYDISWRHPASPFNGQPMFSLADFQAENGTRKEAWFHGYHDGTFYVRSGDGRALRLKRRRTHAIRLKNPPACVVTTVNGRSARFPAFLGYKNGKFYFRKDGERIDSYARRVKTIDPLLDFRRKKSARKNIIDAGSR